MTEPNAAASSAESPPAPTLNELTDDLEAEHAALDAIVAPLSDEQWQLSTPAAGWSVADTIGHLGFFDQAAVLAATDVEAFTAQAEASAAHGEDMMERTLDGPRAMSPAELLAWWRGARVELLATARTMESSTRVAWYGPPMGARSFFTARLMETWAHGCDIADAVGVPNPATDRLRHIAQLGVITRGWSYMVRGLTPPDAEVRVELHAPSGTIWGWGDPQASERVSGTAEDFCRVVTQRGNVADTALSVSGAAAQEWMGIAQAFAGGATENRPAAAGGATGSGG